MNRTRVNVATWIVVFHIVIVALHGLAHAKTQVMLSPSGNAFVIGVVVIAPMVAVLLLRTRLGPFGALLLFGSLFGAFLFGVYNHVLAPGADQLPSIPPGPWQAPFRWTAVLLAIVEGAGASLAVTLLDAQRNPCSRARSTRHEPEGARSLCGKRSACERRARHLSRRPKSVSSG